MARPTSMLPNPAMRSSRSPISSRRVNARFMPRGFRNGAMPSSTRNSATAEMRSDRWGSMTVRWGPSVRGRSALARITRILEVLEEFAVGRNDEHIAVFAEGTLIGLQASVKGVEVGIARIRARINLRRFGIGLAAHPQCIALGGGEYLRALPLGGRADTHRGARAFAAQPTRDFREVLLHAVVDTG